MKIKPGLYVATVVLLLGAVATFVVFLEIREGEWNRFSFVFQQQAKDRALAISREFNLHRHELENFRRFYEQSDEVTKQEFSLYTKPMLAHPCVQALEWIPCVRQHERTAFEERTGIQIKEQAADGRLVPARERATYFPIELAEPFQLNKAALGFDLGSNPERWAALEAARDKGEAHAMELVRLVERPAGPAMFMVVAPVYQEVSETLDERRRNLDGFVLGIYPVDKLVDFTMDPLSDQGLGFLLEDLGAVPGNRLLYRHNPGAGTLDWDAAPDSRLTYVELIDGMGRAWRITIRPNDAFIDAHLSRAYWWVIPFGFLLTLLVARILYMQIDRRLRAELLVGERTTALRESTERFRNITESMSDWIWETDANGVYTYSSAKVKSLLGYTAEETVGKTPFDFMPPAEAERVGAMFGGIARDKRVFRNMENWNLTKDGRSICLLTSGSPILGHDGGLLGYRGVDTDITERMQAEQALRTSEEKFKTLAEMLPEGIFEVDRELKLTYANRRACEMFGYSAEDLSRGLDGLEMLVPEDRDRVKENFSIRIKGGTPGPGEYRALNRRNGSTFPILLHANSIMQGDELAGLRGIVIDITERKRAEDALRESERQYRNLFEGAPIGVFTTHSSGRVISVNPTLARMLGFASVEAAIKHFADVGKLYACADRRNEFLMQLDETGYVEQFEYEANTADGRSIWMSMNARLAGRQADGSFMIEGFVTDVTEQKRSYEVLHESQRQFAALVGNLPGMAYRCKNDEHWTMEFISRGCVEVTGYVAADLIGNRVCSYNDIMHPADREMARRGVDEALQNRRQFEHEYRIITRDGEEKWVWERGIGVYSEAGELLALEGFISDVTSRKQADEDRLRLSAAINQAAEIIIITDVEGTIQYVNPAFEKITGYTREEAIGQNPRMLKSGEQDDAMYAAMWQVLAAGGIWGGRFVNRKKDGTRYTEEATISPVKDAAGKIVNYVGIKSDITAELVREAQARQSQKMEAIGQLAGGVAHDFNNILQTITGFCGLLLAEMDGQSPQRQDLLEIQSAVKHGADLTRQLLTFSRKQPTEYKRIDVNNVLSDAKKMLRHTVDESIRIRFKLAPRLKPVHADAVQVLQMAMNLTVNARDAMPDGGGDNHFHAQQGDHYKGHFCPAGCPGWAMDLFVCFRHRMRDE